MEEKTFLTVDEVAEILTVSKSKASETEQEVADEHTEGKKKVYYTTKYERSTKNREAAIRIHGTKCMICGFDFEEKYGELGKIFWESY